MQALGWVARWFATPYAVPNVCSWPCPPRFPSLGAHRTRPWHWAPTSFPWACFHITHPASTAIKLLFTSIYSRIGPCARGGLRVHLFSLRVGRCTGLLQQTRGRHALSPNPRQPTGRKKYVLRPTRQGCTRHADSGNVCGKHGERQAYLIYTYNTKTRDLTAKHSHTQTRARGKPTARNEGITHSSWPSAGA